VIHDRNSIFSIGLDQALKGLGVRPLKTPVRAPTANAFCERLIGAIRRECLDFLIPVNARHLPSILSAFVIHYNRGRPHSTLGPASPEAIQASVPPAAIDIASQPDIGLLQPLFSADYITSTAWERRLLSGDIIFAEHSRQSATNPLTRRPSSTCVQMTRARPRCWVLS
jgi:integrase-like protein